MSRININSNNNTDAERIEETTFRARAGFRIQLHGMEAFIYPKCNVYCICTCFASVLTVLEANISCHILTANLPVSECIHNSMKLASYAVCSRTALISKPVHVHYCADATSTK